MKRFVLHLLLLVAPFISAIADIPAEDVKNPLDIVIDTIAENVENFSIDEDDFRTIQRKGNIYLIPRHLKQKVLFNIPWFEGQVTVSRVRAGEKILGFRIDTMAARSLFHYLGIRVGDIVRSVNGQALQSEQDAMAIAADLNARSEATVNIERGAARMPLTLTYRLIG